MLPGTGDPLIKKKTHGICYGLNYVPPNSNVETLRPQSSLSVPTHKEKDMWGNCEKATICKHEREVSLETNPTGNLILDFQAPEMWENKFPLLSYTACTILLQQPEQTMTCLLQARRVMNFISGNQYSTKEIVAFYLGE